MPGGREGAGGQFVLARCMPANYTEKMGGFSRFLAGVQSSLADVTKGRLASVQVARAVAAILVVLTHVLHEASKLAEPDSWAVWLSGAFPFAICVDIFFVISGFIMVVISDGRRTDPGYPVRFIRSRIVRIVPNYYFYSAIMVAILLAVPSVFDTAAFSLGRLLKSMVFFRVFTK